jgi:co-chaperonin GroES (HSP10)
VKLKPLGKKIYIILDPVEETKTEGGIIVPDKNVQLVRLATVVAIGDEVTKVAVGDKVLVGFHVGTVLENPILFESSAKDTHRVVTESEIWFLLEE